MVRNTGLNHTHGGNVSSIARKFGLSPEKIIDFSASINPLGVPEKVKKAVVEHFDSVLHYPEQFADTLTHEIAGFHALPEDCIIAGNGSTELIYLIPRVFKPQKALIIIPSFSEYGNALSLAGCRIDTLSLAESKGFAVEFDSLSASLERQYDIMYICNPGNPTGALTPKDTILKLVDEAGSYGTICVVDEAFIDFREEESVKKEAVERPNLIVLRSMTKFYGIPGLRVGFAVSCEDNVNRMMVHKEPWSVNALATVAAAYSLRDLPYIEESKRYVSAERDHLCSELSGISWLKPYPSVANYILLKIERDDLDSDIIFDRLAKEGILIRSCTSFDGLGNRFFRVAVRRRTENERLIGSLKEL